MIRRDAHTLPGATDSTEASAETTPAVEPSRSRRIEEITAALGAAPQDNEDITKEICIRRPPPVNHPVLRVVAGRDLLSFVVLSPGKEVIVGRDDSAELQVVDESVSRKHAAIRPNADGTFTLLDLHSMNGTSLNGVRVTQTLVRPTEEIELGSTSLRIDLMRKEEIDHLIRVQERMRLAENQDPLTGVHLRSFLVDRLPLLIQAARQRNRPISAAFMDIDRFKRINDRFGHAIGDDVLRTTARIGVYGCRDADHVVRYGGEEFVFILVDSNVYGAEEMAQRIRTDIKNHDWRRLTPDLKVTASFGVAQWIPDETPARWIERADQAMYRAKRLGRDRVETNKA